MHKPEPLQEHVKMLELIEQNPNLNLLPLLEMLVQDTPESLEAFCNQAIITVADCYARTSRAAYCPATYWKSLSNCTRCERRSGRYEGHRLGRKDDETGRTGLRPS
jgi:hypothetical protein